MKSFANLHSQHSQTCFLILRNCYIEVTLRSSSMPLQTEELHPDSIQHFLSSKQMSNLAKGI